MTLHGKHVTVMGLGRFGGGSGVARWLAGQGARVLVTDAKAAAELAEPAAELADLLASGQVMLRLGEHQDEDFIKTDLVIANPAVPRPWDNHFLAIADGAGVPVNTEIGLLLERLPNPENTIGVTGTVGKSTTTAMIAHGLMHTDDGGGVALGGNIGVSLLGRLDARCADPITERTAVVLELSSFMLYWIGRVQKWSPRIAVVTNIGDNHTDWHGTLDHYIDSKKQLLANMPAASAGGTAVLGRTVADWAGLAERCGARVVLSDDQPMRRRLALPGRHNAVNARQAALAIGAYRPGADPAMVEDAIAGFAGLEHRLQLVREWRGVRFYNDSKCTTPEACLTAIAALSETEDGEHQRRAAGGKTGSATGSASHIHLIAGGYDKHSDLRPIAALAGDLAGLYCIGATGPTIARLAAESGTPVGASDDRARPAPYVEVCDVLRHAVAVAAARARSGDVVLLSPACASWGQYANYEYRGREFVELVGELG